MKLFTACVLLYAVGHVHGLGRTVLDGDVFIEFIAAIYIDPKNNSDSSCRNIETETVQNIQAIKWTLSKLNEANYIPNVKMGLRVSQTCREEGEAERLALQLAAEMYNSKQDVRIVGVIGSDYSSETEAISRLLSSLPEEHRLLQLAYSATSASLRNRNIYKNFFRTIPPDDIQVEVMIEFLESLNWTYMAIVYDDDSYGRGGRDELLSVVRRRGIDVCFPVLIPVETTYSHMTKLQTEIRDKIIGADIPITGILVFGSSVLANHVLIATENVIGNNSEVARPVFLFSEAGGYIQGQHTDISKGAFVLSPPRRIISKFQEEWTNTFTNTTKLYNEMESNTWIRDVYVEKFNCTLAKTRDENTCRQISIPEFEEAVPNSVYNQYAIQAAMILTKIVKNVFEKACTSNNLCARFLDTEITQREKFIKELSNVSTVNFDNFGSFREIEEFRDPDLVINFNGSVEISLIGDFPIYEVYSHQLCQAEVARTCLIKVAGYKKSKKLQVISTNIKDYDTDGNELLWPNIRKAQCPDGSICSLCLTDRVDGSVLFIPGDMYVVGIVPVHNKGSTPLKCGEMKKGGLDVVETIRFAVTEAKTKPAANIGIIILDSCNDPQIIQEKILTLHRLGVFIDGQYRPVGDKIIGYIGGWSSDVSKAVAEITSRLKYPQISYASTAPVLSKRSLYPYFLRVPSPDDKQAETILKLVQMVGGDFIQIAHSASAYGEGGRDILLDLIKTFYVDICVAQTLSVTTSSDGAGLLYNLRRFAQAKIVVLFLGSFEVAHMLETLSKVAKNEFLFISSEGWGIRFDVREYHNLVGSITVTSQLTINEKLKDHMELLSPEDSNVNPWVRSYIQEEFDCYFEWSYNKTSRKKCQEASSLNVYTTDFRLDAWTPFAERAVRALLAGVEKVLRDKCDGSTASLCDKYRNSIPDVFEAIKGVNFQGINGFDTRIFNDNGDGTVGYQIYVVALQQGRQYLKVGDSSLGVDDEKILLTFQKSVFNDIRGEVVSSTCSGNVDKCGQCFPLKPVKNEDSNQSAGVIVAVIILGVVCCVLAGIVLFYCCRLGFCITIDNGRVKVNSTYITPVYKRRKESRSDDVDEHYPNDDYDCIPVPPTPSLSSSQVLNSDGRSHTLDGSASSQDTRNQEIGINGHSSKGKIQMDNEAFSDRFPERVINTQHRLSEDEQPSWFQLGPRKDSYLELGGPRKDSYLNSDLNLREKIFPKTAPLPDLPSETI